VKAEQNAVAPTPPSLFIARRQLSELQPVGSKADGTVCEEVVLELECDDVDVGDGLMEL
jgi:hypothetical protein